MIIGYTVLEIWRDGCNYFSFWAIFCLFTPLTARKMKIFFKMKKTPGDIIILHKCTRNHDHMLHCSLYMARDTCNFYFSFWAFLPFYPLPAKKIKRMKKTPGDITILHVYQKLWLDDVWFLRYQAHRTGRHMDTQMEKVTYRGRCPT